MSYNFGLYIKAFVKEIRKHSPVPEKMTHAQSLDFLVKYLNADSISDLDNYLNRGKTFKEIFLKANLMIFKTCFSEGVKELSKIMEVIPENMEPNDFTDEIAELVEKKTKYKSESKILWHVEDPETRYNIGKEMTAWFDSMKEPANPMRAEAEIRNQLLSYEKKYQEILNTIPDEDSVSLTADLNQLRSYINVLKWVLADSAVTP